MAGSRSIVLTQHSMILWGRPAGHLCHDPVVISQPSTSLINGKKEKTHVLGKRIPNQATAIKVHSVKYGSQFTACINSMQVQPAPQSLP